jgi:hypothetical protein
MANWFDGLVQNTSPMAYQPNTQFQLPSFGPEQNGLLPNQQLMPVMSAMAASGQTPLTGSVDETSAGGLWGGGDLWGMLGSKDGKGNRTDGWGGMALGVAQGLSGAFMGAKQYQLAQDALSENKRQFGMNYANQSKTINAELEDRQRARVASNPGAYQSVGDYMQKNGV